MRITLGKLFRHKVQSHVQSNAQPQPQSAAPPTPLALDTTCLARPIDIVDSPKRLQRHDSAASAARWMLKPARNVVVPCLRTIVSGKLEPRTRRALRRLGEKPEVLDAMLVTRSIDPAVRDRLPPEDRVLLQFCVGGEAQAVARQQALRANPTCTPADSRELNVLEQVLQPFNALRALFDLEDATGLAPGETPEHLARAVLEALCDDLAGKQAQRGIALVACDLDVRHGGLFKAQRRVAVAQVEMLTGQPHSEPVKITQALDIALQHLGQAGFPDMRR